MFVYLCQLAETARCIEVTTLLLRLDGYMYGSLKGHLSLTWKIGVCFVENRSLFSKNRSLNSKIGVCFKKMGDGKWESVFENVSLKMGVFFFILNHLILAAIYLSISVNWVIHIRGTQRRYSSKPLKHSIVERILV